MSRNDCILRSDERIGYALRGLYAGYGYSRFKMGKFEEYELYANNRDFLTGDRMITFTDGDGTLMALKPDVTISIIKNTQEGDKGVRKVYYNETVYRLEKGERHFREIMQMGLECVGELDAYQLFEVIFLAGRSLELISADYVLDISHMGLISGLMTKAGVPESYFTPVLAAVREKNPTELTYLCKKLDLDARGAALLQLLIDLYGDIHVTLNLLEPYCTEQSAKEALEQLRVVDTLLRASGMNRRVQLDFSVVNDMGYYNGIVFRGFIKGVAEGVLSGGQYDLLVEKMGKNFGAIGFAINLNELERLEAPPQEYDVDVLLLYDDKTDFSALSLRSRELVAAGKQVITQRAEKGSVHPREVYDLRGGKELGR